MLVAPLPDSLSHFWQSRIAEFAQAMRLVSLLGSQFVVLKKMVESSWVAFIVLVLATATAYADGEQSATGGINLWPRAGASSVSPNHPASEVTASRLGAYWQAETPSLPQWLVIDLGRKMPLRAVRQTFHDAGYWRFTISGSDTGATSFDQDWVVLAQQDGKELRQTFEIPLRGEWRYLRLMVTAGGVASSAEFRVTTDVLQTTLVSPQPEQVPHSPLLIVESCDIWYPGRLWESLVDAPSDWRPVGGEYNEAVDAVTDMHIRQALNAGIDGFQSCWFREKQNAGQNVMTEYDGFIQSIAYHAALRNLVVWSIFWDNANPAADSMKNGEDFIMNIAPFWLDAYLTRPNYLKIAGLPIVAIANVERFVADAGGVSEARDAITSFKMQAKKAGLPGVFLIGNNVTNPKSSNTLAKNVGFDAVMTYATPIYTGLLGKKEAPTENTVMDAQRESWLLLQKHSALPAFVTVSVGYDERPWKEGVRHYLLSPANWHLLVHAALTFVRSLPGHSPSRHLLYLDAWNEFGEGHFIEPSEAFGSQYLQGLTPGNPAVVFGPD